MLLNCFCRTSVLCFILHFLSGRVSCQEVEENAGYTSCQNAAHSAASVSFVSFGCLSFSKAGISIDHQASLL
jgi:hypothetical protein